MKEQNILQESKNTVSAENQLPRSQFVNFYGDNSGSPKILFLGNSITRHGRKDDIGWFHDFGMAASCEEKDYVHLVMAKVRAKCPNACFCVTQGAGWERDELGFELEANFNNAREFAADFIIYRIGENTPMNGFTVDYQKMGTARILGFLTEKNPSAKVIFTTNFWANPEKDRAIEEYAAEQGRKPVYLGDLGNSDENKAVGLFEHSGVANHPGDLGMKRIAERIFAELDKEL